MPIRRYTDPEDLAAIRANRSTNVIGWTVTMSLFGGLSLLGLVFSTIAFVIMAVAAMITAIVCGVSCHRDYNKRVVNSSRAARVNVKAVEAKSGYDGRARQLSYFLASWNAMVSAKRLHAKVLVRGAIPVEPDPESQSPAAGFIEFVSELKNDEKTYEASSWKNGSALYKHIERERILKGLEPMVPAIMDALLLTGTNRIGTEPEEAAADVRLVIELDNLTEGETQALIRYMDDTSSLETALASEHLTADDRERGIQRIDEMVDMLVTEIGVVRSMESVKAGGMLDQAIMQTFNLREFDIA